ncbi:serine hydrolase [Micromonospora sp. WMMA1363]|uniref:serine hydrolase domain-containing protein n=1 Tax=Micromonospora sp. WMMA1363 TaxID=3053985 RepID=UPI00259CBE36|nr:serine hydrolase [Micromonospora sp. WMMA1363]MDM4721992.1 serine hydrolase [Micromonospora sp. WMMA1363]
MAMSVMFFGPAGAVYADTERFPEQHVEEYRAVYGAPGVAAAVIDNGVLQKVVSGRDGDGQAVTSRTRFRVASMSKSMTAAAIMLMVKRGAFSLDEPVARVLPEFSMDDSRYSTITVRHLLNHSSGLSLRTNDEYAFPPPHSAADVVAGLTVKKLAADPGTRWEYHNTNYAIAARIVEVHSGVGFDEFLQTELFTPLGMRDTTATEGCSDPVDGLASGHAVVLGIAVTVPEMPGMCVGNGGVVSTLDDMIRWVQFNQGALDSDLLNEGLLAQMHTPQSGDFGLGWQARAVGDEASPSLVAHGGTLATWTGDMAFSPGTGVAAIALTNSGGAPSTLTTNLVAERLGLAQTPLNNPLAVVNAVLLALTVIVALLLVIAVVRAPRWATGRHAASRPFVVARLTPIALLTTLGLFLPTLVGAQAGVFNFQYWIVVAWLMPLLALFSLVCLVLGATALARRIWYYRRGRRADTVPSASTSTPLGAPNEMMLDASSGREGRSV